MSDTHQTEDFDVSKPELFRDDTWQPFFAKLREQDPVHYHEDSPNGAFWSVTSHALIKEVDTNHTVFSSAGGISIIDEMGDGTAQAQTEEEKQAASI